MNATTASVVGVLLCSVGVVACSPATSGAPNREVDGTEPVVERGQVELESGATVATAVGAGCSTTSVLGLSEQIVAQLNCLLPDVLAAVPGRPNLTKSDATFAFMQPAARDALVAALDANPGMTLSVSSMFRTVAQQYLLYRWGQLNTCGVEAAATPGNSNHESGLALDTSEYSAWQSALESNDFQWYGTGDDVHFDYVGSSVSDLKGVDVKAFQMLWNANHSHDPISVDGVYGNDTATRLAQSPATGFLVGASCSNATDPGTDPGSGSAASCASSCGTSAPVPNSNPNCYCDSSCTSYGDCCGDYSELCSSTPSPEKPSAPSCTGLCGSSNAAPGSSPACYCDSICLDYGDCCPDASSICGF